MKRKEDPARADAQARVDVLCRGIGNCMIDAGRCESAAEIRRYLAIANTQLAEALDDLERAETAYQPFWAGRRRRIHRVHRVVAKKKKVA